MLILLIKKTDRIRSLDGRLQNASCDYQEHENALDRFPFFRFCGLQGGSFARIQTVIAAQKQNSIPVVTL
jgi:hypothetical protein